MGREILNDGETGGVIRGKINDNFEELYNDIPTYRGTVDPAIDSNPLVFPCKYLNTVEGEFWLCLDNTTDANIWRCLNINPWYFKACENTSAGDVVRTGRLPLEYKELGIGDNQWDTVNYQIVLPKTGLYHFGWCHYSNESYSTSGRRVMIERNDDKIAQVGQYANTTTVHVDYVCQVGDIISVSAEAFHTSYYASMHHNSFYGHLINRSDIKP